MRIALLMTIASILSACSDVPWAGQAESPAAAVRTDAFPPGARLADGLAIVEATLDSALATRLDEAGVPHLLRAEALSDRVLETEMPFAWLAAQNYSVEARVWQIQAQADRIVARLRAGARREDLLPEVEVLRGDVNSLRTALASGGEPQPPPVEYLLEQLDSAGQPLS
jgi:hypothetical protein